MTSGGWRLQPDAEREILLPWLESETDPFVRLAVIVFLDDLLRKPDRPHLEDGETGVFSIRAVPGTSVGIIWILDRQRRLVTLAFLG